MIPDAAPPVIRKSIDPRFVKYAGKKLPVFRSSWELAYASTIDRSPSVKGWASEAFSISYYNPVKKKYSQYWPDFLVSFENGSVLLVEIKPLKEAAAANAKSTYDKLSLVQNMAKWDAASKFAKQQGWLFRVYTERDLAGIINKRSSTRKTSGTVKPKKANGTRK